MHSTELTQNSDALNSNLPTLPNVNTSLPILHRQNSVHLNTEPIISNNSTQPTLVNNQIIQITPQQLVNIVRQLIPKISQKTTKVPTPYYLQAGSKQTP